MNFKAQTKPRAPRLTAWSYSRYGDWRKCPLSAKLKHIDRIKEPSSAAMERGSAIHTLAEGYIKGTEAKLAPELALFKDEFKDLRARYKKKSVPVIVEDNWAFTKEWGETQWDNWAECWVRIKLDCAHYVADGIMVVTDWKSGRPRDEKTNEYMEQLELYALAALALHGHLNEVRVRIGWTDVGEMYSGPEGKPATYFRKDLAKLKKLWNGRVAPMMADTQFAPKPNAGCRWCYYGQAGKAKGGPGLCKF